MNVEDPKEELEDDEEVQRRRTSRVSEEQQRRRTTRVIEKDRKTKKSTAISDNPTSMVMVGGTSNSDEDLAKHSSMDTSRNASHAKVDRGSHRGSSDCGMTPRAGVLG